MVISVGEFAGVEIHALEFAFQVLSRSTLAEGAELVIERVPIVLACRSCGMKFNGDRLDIPCVSCGGGEIDLIQGRELDLKTIAGERHEQSD